MSHEGKEERFWPYLRVHLLLVLDTAAKVREHRQTDFMRWRPPKRRQDTMVQNRKKNTAKVAIYSFTLPRAWKWVSEQASEWARRSSQAQRSTQAKWASEWVVQANKRMNERVAQYLRLDFWLFWTIVQEKDEDWGLSCCEGKGG